MTAKIVTLSNTRRSNVVCRETGVVFPQIFRLTGKTWEFKDGRVPDDCFIKSTDELQPSKDDVAPTYVLEYGHQYVRIATPHWEPIRFLDPMMDSGWVIVRHHCSRELADGYIDAMLDTNTHESIANDWWGMFQTELGLFSLLHRPAAAQTRDCLLIFITKVHGPYGLLDWFHVIGPDGEELDENALYPDEDNAFMQPLVDKLNKDEE